MTTAVQEKIVGFFSAYPLKHGDAGQTLISPHEEPAGIFFLLEGRVKQYDISARGDEVVLNVFKPPAFFPMSYAINRSPNVYFYQAETPVDFRQAPHDAVVKFVKDNPDVLFDLLGRVYQGLDGILGRLAHLMGGSARSRVLYELLIESRRFGTPRGKGVAIYLNESDLAARAGLARETVSREIHKLKDEGLISIIKNEIWINDIDRLSASVGPEL